MIEATPLKCDASGGLKCHIIPVDIGLKLNPACLWDFLSIDWRVTSKLTVRTLMQVRSVSKLPFWLLLFLIWVWRVRRSWCQHVRTDSFDSWLFVLAVEPFVVSSRQLAVSCIVDKKFWSGRKMCPIRGSHNVFLPMLSLRRNWQDAQTESANWWSEVSWSLIFDVEWRDILFRILGPTS